MIRPTAAEPKLETPIAARTISLHLRRLLQAHRNLWKLAPYHSGGGTSMTSPLRLFTRTICQTATTTSAATRSKLRIMQHPGPVEISIHRKVWHGFPPDFCLFHLLIQFIIFS